MSAYTESLASGSTTLCRCFRLTRADGVVMGFTDHDTDIGFDGLSYRSGAALSASEASATLGLAPDEMDVAGALAHDALTEADIVAGKYDGAGIEVWDVDWRNTAARALLGRYSVGEIERGGLAFRAEVRSLTALLDRAEGRVHTTLCDVRRLGDGRCKLDLAGWQAPARVLRTEGANITVSGLGAFAAGTFDRGIVAWTGGDNAGQSGDIRVSDAAGGEVTLSLWRLPAAPVRPGDPLTATAGCDRTAATCHARFANLINFRGFPHMPGEAFLRDRGIEGDPDQTGGSRFD